MCDWGGAWCFVLCALYFVFCTLFSLNQSLD
jgi:hypothetical protein